ncbi:MAG: carboxymuconolactone decarboxylase family protein [Mycobacteriaceae bacterium]|nr:carboxymuconolactone decarboxylase family protein [Mycobacteriaceae bacterium]
MSRIGNYADDDLTSWFASSPELGAAIGNFSDAVYHRSRLPVRVREIARMAIALDNECAVCENTRFEGAPQAGVDEKFYAHVAQWRSWPGYSVEERIAAEFGERFASDHTGLRDDEEFWERCKQHFSDELLADLALSCALWIGMGRVLRTLDIGQACKITV